MTSSQEQKIMEFNCQVTELGNFLQKELTISAAELSLIRQKQKELKAPIPMLLWQYGLVSLAGLDRIFDWLESCH